MTPTWTPASWQDRAAAEQPDWPDTTALEATLLQLRQLPPLIYAGEARRLQDELAGWPPARPSCSRPGTAPSRSTSFSADAIRDKLKVILQMAVVLTYGVGGPRGEGGPDRRAVRQAPFLPHRDDGRRRAPVVPGPHRQRHRLDAAAGAPTRSGCCGAYQQSASTLNLLRAFTKGGYADLRQGALVEPGVRGVEPRRASATSRSADEIDSRPAVHGRRAASTWTTSPACTRSTSGRATRRSCSATRRRSPARTRSPATGTTARPTCCGSASGPASSTAPTSSSSPASTTPSAARSGPTVDPREAAAVCERLNPGRVPGRLTLITRMGAAGSRPCCPRCWPPCGTPAIPSCGRATPCTATPTPVRRAARPATSTTSSTEVEVFFAAHRAEGTWPGGHPRRAHGRRRDRVPRRRRRPDGRPSRRSGTRRCATRA